MFSCFGSYSDCKFFFTIGLVASFCKFIVYSHQIHLGLGPSLTMWDCHRMFYTPAYVHHQLITGEELPLAHCFWYVFLDLPYGIRNKAATFQYELMWLMHGGMSCGGIFIGASRMDVVSIYFLLEPLFGDDSEGDSNGAMSYLLECECFVTKDRVQHLCNKAPEVKPPSPCHD